MSTIRILDDKVVNQIAAGEVVERPASVVKELVENSIDARATEITVAIANGGRTSIEVLDNGCGMSKDDALLAVERFGTSKIRSTDDLQEIATHGFRGEALPSIASVSKFRLFSATESGEGVQISIDGGTIRDVREASLQPGTRIVVQQLFFNVPARRKFLRTENTEAALVRTLMHDFALAYPLLRFRLVVDGAQSTDFAPVESFFARAKLLESAGERPLVDEEVLTIASGAVTARIYLSQPVECVSGSSRLRLIVNRRVVRDKLLLKAVRDGYGNFLRPGRYPVGAVMLEMPPSEIDVNVHPQKTEIRFRRPEVVFAVVNKVISRALGGFPKPNPVALDELRGNGFEQAEETETQTGPGALHSPTALQNPAARQLDIGSLGASRPMLLRSTSERLALHLFRFVGQIFHCYLLLEGEGRVALVDMHAAHERVMFFRLKCQLRAGTIHSQVLLLPETVSLAPDRMDRFEQFQPVLERLGIDADRISETQIVVRALPALLSRISAAAIFAELSTLSEWSSWGDGVEHLWDLVIARLACHRSVRSGRDLEPREVYELLESLDEAETSGFCPHGRPIVTWLRQADLEAMFGRDV